MGKPANTQVCSSFGCDPLYQQPTSFDAQTGMACESFGHAVPGDKTTGVVKSLRPAQTRSTAVGGKHCAAFGCEPEQQAPQTIAADAPITGSF